jgi:quercetin dioxygenase-like cupin family protein
MPFVDTGRRKTIERLPGWHGRYFHSTTMTFAHYDFARGASIHKHFHREEEIYESIDGELRVTVEGAAQVVNGTAIAVDPPARRDFGAE